MQLTSPKKIGLVGYCCLTGLGELNNQLADHLPIAEWLIFPHRAKTTKKPRNYIVPFRELADNPENQEAIRQFVDRNDVILFCETPYYSKIIEYAEQMGKRIVCIPMQEWMPPPTYWWLKSVHRFICPIFYAYQRFHDSLPCMYFDWPVDISRFSHIDRPKCERFLFLNGNGGHQGRKGIDTIKRALVLWPEMPLTVFSQNLQMTKDLKATRAKNLVITGETLCNTYLYLQGDVLICPHTIDGLALEPREAAACGVPSLITEGPIWDDITCALARIPSGKSVMYTKTQVDCWVPSPQRLVSLCQKFLGTNILDQSRACRAWAEDHSWAKHKADLLDLIVSD